MFTAHVTYLTEIYTLILIISAYTHYMYVFVYVCICILCMSALPDSGSSYDGCYGTTAVLPDITMTVMVQPSIDLCLHLCYHDTARYSAIKVNIFSYRCKYRCTGVSLIISLLTSRFIIILNCREHIATV